MKTKRLTRAAKEAQGLTKPAQSNYEKRKAKGMTADQSARLQWEANSAGMARLSDG